jgi:predicted nucleic acid-binding protein
VIFVDTGPFLARWVVRDQHHPSALRAWREIESRAQRCATSNFVIDETLTLLARRVSYAFAAERGRSLYGSTFLTILRPDRDDEMAALQSFSKLADQDVSFTDCVSFALMKRHRLRRAFTFDGHFAAAGLELWPKPSRAD